MKVLITGGAGYIGSILIQYLLNRNYKVTVLDNLFYGQDSLINFCSNKNFNFIYGDARDKEILRDQVPLFDVIIPLACIVGAPACDKNPDLARSLNFGAIHSLNNIRSKNQIIIFPNTNSGYGISEQESFCDENTPLKPISLYGRSKVEAENLLLSTENTITLRLATVFGVSPRMRMDLLVNDFVYRAVNDKVLVLFEENFRRNFIHIQDVAMTFHYCIENFEKLKNEPYNVGLSEANLTKRQLAEKIKDFVPDLEIMVSEFGKDVDKRDYIVSNKKLEETGWFAGNNLEDGIKELIKCYNMINPRKYSNI